MNEPISILLVDDDASYVDFIHHQLTAFQQKAFKTTWVNSGKATLEVLSTNPSFDLILMDYFFPDGNGVDIAKEIAARKITIPIILLTSNKDFRIAIEAMKYGVEDYLVKEDAVDSVLPRTIVNVLERRKLNRQRSEAEKQELLTHKANEAIQELIVTMCHEFNNPLAAIKISTDILLRQKVSDEQKSMLAKLNSHILHLEKQIIKLRDLNTAKASPKSNGS